MFRYLPEQASEFAPNVDWIHNLITDLSVFFTVVIVGAMIYFAIRYRRRDGVDHETPQIRGSHTLEVIWTVVPTVISIIVAYYGVIYYRDMRIVPKDAITINVSGRKWQWAFQYENGKKLEGKNVEFVVPVDKPVKLVMQSEDVLHSFFLPAMRVKKDVIPGQYTYLTFKPVKTGNFQAFCTEYCGLEHWNMMASLRVVPPAEYERWLQDRSEEIGVARLTPVEKGKTLYAQKGCNACHSLDGVKIVGPSLLKLWQSEVSHSDGSKALVDENYLRESILNPNAKIVAGYQPNLMPSFQGQLSDDEVSGLIAFIKTIDGSQAIDLGTPKKKAVDEGKWASLSAVEKGKIWYEEKAVPACKTCHTLDGSNLVGPSFKGIFGREEEMQDGTKVVVDEAYIKESIQNPMAKVVKGMPPSMPPYQLSDEAISELTEYLKTLK